MKRQRMFGAAMVAAASMASLALAGGLFETGPMPSFSGAPAVADKPGEYNCSVCHANFEWNNINTPGGAVELFGLPDDYETCGRYLLTVRLHTDSTATFPGRRWGFQLTAIREVDGEGCGIFHVEDTDTLQIVSDLGGPFASRQYVTHTEFGRRDSVGSEASWSFWWRAPHTPKVL